MSANNNNRAANQYIRMISEGSCDTEDWSNDAEYFAVITAINYTLTDTLIENSYFKLKMICQYYYYHSLVEQKILFSNIENL